MRKNILLSMVVLIAAIPAFAETAFRCESTDGHYRECRAEGVGNIMLTQQLSDASCVEGQTWGYRNGMIWVDRGCRADFAFTTVDRLNTFVLCESKDGKTSRCSADTGGGVRLARQISDNACRFGRDWGYDANGIWVTNGCRGEFGVRSAMATTTPQTTLINTGVPTIRCESLNNNRHHCDADTRFGVAIAQQLSDNNCVRDKTWGVDKDGIWVWNGCRADFVVGTATTMISAAPAPAQVVIVQQPPPRHVVVVPPAQRPVIVAPPEPVVMAAPVPRGPVYVCESIDGQRNHCALDTSMGVNLVRQLSDADCQLNKTWGVDASGIWVSGGCRGEFTPASGRISLGDVPASARVVCESKDGKRNVCPADTRLGIAVVRQLSDSDCKLNSTWGYDTNGIWVTAGCRAEFILRR